MTIIGEKTEVDKKASAIQLLALLFPEYKSLFTPRSLMLTKGDEIITIDENNFEDLQIIVKQALCLGKASKDSFNPANAAAKEIAEKLMRGRQRVAAQKAKEGGDSIFTQYLSILTVGLESMGLNELMNLTMFQLYDLVERYMLYSNWDLDVRQRLAGGKPDSEPENWMKDIHSNSK
jgi:hypothetical protein